MVQRTEFERVSPESVGVRSEAIEWLLDQLESGFTEPHGLMIMRHGKICAEGWWNPYAPGIRHGLQSHTKTYAATAVGIAYTEGLLDLNERIIDIFPEYAPERPSENLKKLTVHHVLSMGCGMDSMPKPTKDWIREFLATPVDHEPGTTYMYNSMGSTLLGAIVRKKSGLGLEEYLKPRLFDKIGIDCSNHKWIYMPDGMEVGGGGLFATTEDNLRLMKLYADGGVWNGTRILAEDYVRRAVTCQNPSATESINNPEAADNFVGYGYQIWMCRPKGVYRADGAMGQFTIVFPDKDMIIAITENASGAHWAQKTLDVMWEFLNRITDTAEENSAEAAKLENRLSRLALPRVPFAPFCKTEESIQDQDWSISEGYLSFDNYFGDVFMGGKSMPSSIASLRFHFEPDQVEIHCLVDGAERKLIAAMDGSRRYNRIPGKISEALLSASWKDEKTLELRIRWIETCNEDAYNFSFEDGVLKICHTALIFGQPKTEIVTALEQ